MVRPFAGRNGDFVMTNVNSIAFRQNLTEYLNDAIHHQQVILVENGRDNVVVLSEAR